MFKWGEGPSCFESSSGGRWLSLLRNDGLPSVLTSELLFILKISKTSRRFAHCPRSDSWHGISMKRVGWLRKLCLGSCVSMKERDNLNGFATGAPSIGTEVMSARGAIAEATGASATAALALGGLAVGSLAVGFLVIHRLIVRELLVKRVHLHHLRIDQLEVDDLRVKKLTILEKERPTDGTDQPLPDRG